jgi:uncharacterized protein with gpF-like domain
VAKKRTFRVVLAEILENSARLPDEAAKMVLTEMATLRTELRRAITDSGMRYSERQALFRQLDVQLKNSALRMEDAGLTMFDEAWESGWTSTNQIMMGVPVDAGWGEGGPEYYEPEVWSPYPGFAVEPSQFVKEGLRQLTTSRIVGVTEQMQEQILQQVQIGFVGGLSPNEVMFNITNIVGIRDLPQFRELGTTGISAKAENIFRTEIMTAQNAAKDEYLKGAGEAFPDLKKVWLATGDDRTRDSHIDAHFQVVSVNDVFTVGGHPAQYPLDNTLPLRERARCRCTSTPYREGWGPLEELMPDQAMLVQREKEIRGLTTPVATARTRNIGAAMDATKDQIKVVREAVAAAEKKYGREIRGWQSTLKHAKRSRLDRETSLRVARRTMKGGQAHQTLIDDAIFKLEYAIKQEAEVIAKLDELMALRRKEIGDALFYALKEEGVAIEYDLLLHTKTQSRYKALTAEKKKIVDDAIEFIQGVTSAEHEWFRYQIAFPEGSFSFEAVFVDDVGRAYQSGKTTTLYSHNTVSTQIHELGHIIEEFSPHMHARAIEYLEYRRLPGERAKKLSQLTGKSGYKPSEKAFKDTWTNPYAGKIYQQGGEYYASEVISMGIQQLYDDPYAFMANDPGHFHFIVGLLRGWW